MAMEMIVVTLEAVLEADIAKAAAPEEVISLEVGVMVQMVMEKVVMGMGLSQVMET